MILSMDKLNAEQLHAASADGDVLLLACPGSGKTRTLIHRIARELQSITSHREFVVALTYTHVAAEEIRDRIEAMGVDTSQLWIGTIHSFCLNWILKPYYLYHPKLKDGFAVVDTYESEQLLDALAKQNPPLSNHFDCKYFASETGFSLDQHLPSVKVRPAEIVLSTYLDLMTRARKIDFEMLLKYSFDLIRVHEPLARRLSQLIRLVAVDEYQDTRSIQYAILTAIASAKESSTRLFIVGDSNQAIFGSLGGVAQSASQIGLAAQREVTTLRLENNYRSSQGLVDYFSRYAVDPVNIKALGADKDFDSEIVHDVTIHKDDLVGGLAQLIRYNIEVLGVKPESICVVAPWWIHLAPITRGLVEALPDLNFNGPGLSPFGQNVDNFWYKLARLGLTSAAPDMLRKRLRWAQEVIDELVHHGAMPASTTARDLLHASNGLRMAHLKGSASLVQYFDEICGAVGVYISPGSELADQRDGFFDRMTARLSAISAEGVDADRLEAFQKVFRPRTGVVVSTVHGVKGAEYDSVIGFAFLEGFIPHFAEPASGKHDSAKKMLFVAASRAKKHLFLISERGRGHKYYPKVASDVLVAASAYPYTSRSIFKD